MTPAALLLAVLQYGPGILPLIQSLVTMVKANKTEVTPEDLAQLVALGKKTSADYLKDAGGAPS